MQKTQYAMRSRNLYLSISITDGAQLLAWPFANTGRNVSKLSTKITAFETRFISNNPMYFITPKDNGFLRIGFVIKKELLIFLARYHQFKGTYQLGKVKRGIPCYPMGKSTYLFCSIKFGNLNNVIFSTYLGGFFTPLQIYNVLKISMNNFKICV